MLRPRVHRCPGSLRVRLGRAGPEQDLDAGAERPAGGLLELGRDSGGVLAPDEAPGLSRCLSDTVGEFPQAADQPEPGQDEDSGERESRFSDGPDEFANGILSFSATRGGCLARVGFIDRSRLSER